MKKESKLTHWRREIYLFLKAQVSSQIASVADFFVTIVLAMLGVFYLYATFAGSIVGGVVNCFINYHWVFHPDRVKKKYVAVKYSLVWAGSILLNTWGTYLLTEWLTGMTWLNNLLSHHVNSVFIVAKAIVALLVGTTWNYHMQRVFVYRNHEIRQFWRDYFGE